MLRANNAQLDALLKNNDINNPKVKEIIRKMKVQIKAIIALNLQHLEHSFVANPNPRRSKYAKILY